MQIFLHFFHVFLKLFFCQNNPPLFSDNDGLFDDNAGVLFLKFNV